MKKKISFEIIALIAITILAVIHLLNNSYFTVHDDQHIARLYLLDSAIKQGDLFPRWVGGLGFNFGYPLFNFYPPLIYYVAEFFHLIGFNLLWSLKMMLVTGSFISSIGIYVLGKRLFNRRAGLLAATLHTFFFYRIVTLFIRGAWAEFFAMSIVPYVILGMDSINRKQKMRFPILFSMSVGLLILAHPLIAFPTFFYIAFFLIFYLINSSNRWELFKRFCVGTVFGLGISAFFWLPSLIEKQYTLVNTILTHELASYKLHFIYPFQLWFSPWGYGGSIAGSNDGMTFQLGKIHILLLFISLTLSLFYFFFKKRKESMTHHMFLIFLFAFSLFMSITYSEFIWDKISYLWYLQFPWRFLTFSGIFMSLIAGAGIYYLEKICTCNTKSGNMILLFVAIVTILITVYKYSPYTKPYLQKNYDERYLTSTEEISWRVSNTSFEFSPIGIKTKKTLLGTTTIGLDKQDLVKETYTIFGKENDTKVTTLINNYSKKEFHIEAKNSVVFRLNTFNFPGWRAKLNGKEITIDDKNDFKLITVYIPKGSNTLSFTFSNTLVRTIADFISLISLGALTVFGISRKKNASKA